MNGESAKIIMTTFAFLYVSYFLMCKTKQILFLANGWAPEIEKVGDGERLSGRAFQKQSWRSRYWDIVLPTSFLKGQFHETKNVQGARTFESLMFFWRFDFSFVLGDIVHYAFFFTLSRTVRPFFKTINFTLIIAWIY